MGGKERLVCVVCEFVHWDNPKPVTATLIPYDDGLVLVKRRFAPFIDDWCLPGGFMEALESPEESAAREVLEETGLEVQITRLLGAHSPGNYNVVSLFYLGIPKGGALVPGDDASDVGVFTQETLPANIAFMLHNKMIKQFFATAGNLDKGFPTGFPAP
jgi:8-oxo-dGTP diphosphatase